MNAPKPRDIEALCAAKGMRMTEQRRVIARVLAAADDHPDVEELYRRCAAVDDRISISTVYRTVKLFEDAGIIERHDFRNGPRALRADTRQPSRPPHQSAHRRGDRVPVGGDRTAAGRGGAARSATGWSIIGSNSTPSRSTTSRSAEGRVAIRGKSIDECIAHLARCCSRDRHGRDRWPCADRHVSRPAGEDVGRLRRRRRHRRCRQNSGAKADRSPGSDGRRGEPPRRERDDRRRGGGEIGCPMDTR